MTDLRHLGAHRLDVAFSDGSHGVHDFADILGRTGEMIRPLADPAYFGRVFLEDGVPTWPNGYDWDPAALHAEMSAAGQLLGRAAAE